METTKTYIINITKLYNALNDKNDLNMTVDQMGDTLLEICKSSCRYEEYKSIEIKQVVNDLALYAGSDEAIYDVLINLFRFIYMDMGDYILRQNGWMKYCSLIGLNLEYLLENDYLAAIKEMTNNTFVFMPKLDKISKPITITNKALITNLVFSKITDNALTVRDVNALPNHEAFWVIQLIRRYMYFRFPTDSEYCNDSHLIRNIQSLEPLMEKAKKEGMKGMGKFIFHKVSDIGAKDMSKGTIKNGRDVAISYMPNWNFPKENEKRIIHTWIVSGAVAHVYIDQWCEIYDNWNRRRKEKDDNNERHITITGRI